jgi:ferrous iron transport protein B
MVAALLFRDQPLYAALVFVAAYTLGLTAALTTAFLLKQTLIPGDSAPLVIELPPYRRPSIRNALLTVAERALVFLKNAGTVILCISVVLWALATYPRLPDSQVPADVAAQLTQLQSAVLQAEQQADEEVAAQLESQMQNLRTQAALEYSIAGRAGRMLEPVFAPLGFDWKINVGVLSSFAAREVLVSTLAIVYGLGEEGAEERETLVETLRRQQRADGTPVFTTATSLSLLVFYVLAMQCLPTQAVTRRETGSWRWALLQLGYMTVLAYTAALVVYQTTRWVG